MGIVQGLFSVSTYLRPNLPIWHNLRTEFVALFKLDNDYTPDSNLTKCHYSWG